jgi:hypothetical protein
MAAEMTKEQARRKLIHILPRNVLEDLSGLEQPWHSDRTNLEAAALAKWDWDEVEIAIMKILERAR